MGFIPAGENISFGSSSSHGVEATRLVLALKANVAAIAQEAKGHYLIACQLLENISEGYTYCAGP